MTNRKRLPIMLRRLLATVGMFVSITTSFAPSASAAPSFDEDCNAPEYTGRAAASLCYPIEQGRAVVIEGPATIWRMRIFAEQLDAALPGLDVRSAACSDFPGAFCLRVVKADKGATYQGLTEWDQVDHPDGSWSVLGATITLNTYYAYTASGFRRAVAAHEFMHALGFQHHAGPGVVGKLTPALTPTPSADEWSALGAWYGPVVTAPPVV